jgi:quinoprotein glucose dehydrogenase
MFRRLALLSSLIALAASAVGIQLRAARVQADTDREASREWRVYGGDLASTHSSPLTQITKRNVSRLRIAWQFDVPEPGGSPFSPIMVDGVVFVMTPGGRLVALSAATGTVRWEWNPGLGRNPVRGVSYWTDGTDARLFAGYGRFVFAVDARTGTPISSFGVDGRIDLHRDLGRDAEQQSVGLTTPGVVVRDVLIVGGRTSETLPASPGDVRAYDVRSGRLRWSFRTIPHPGETGYDTWPADAWTYIGSANNWAGMSVDRDRGIVYVPTGSASSDFYGANRIGDNLFANTLLALDAATGKRLWHFQGVRHDIWDRDFPSPPVLATLRRDGRMVDAVIQPTKQGVLFVFDRTNGRPLFPIEERRVPPSTVDGEVAARMQPWPTRPRPFSRQRLTEDLLSRRTPQTYAWALEQFRTFRSEGQFVPLSVGTETVIFPGYDGGAEWGGSAIDPRTGVLYVNANDIAWTGSLAPSPPADLGKQTYMAQCAACHGSAFEGVNGQAPALLSTRTRPLAEVTAIVRNGGARMPGFSSLSQDALSAVVRYVVSGGTAAAGLSAPTPLDLKYRFTGYKRWLDPDGFPAVAPPWGTLNAIDLNTGDFRWTRPLGEYPALAAQGLKGTGSENYGGPIVTAGGVLFIGATMVDRKFRAFDKDTGALLWETTMPNSANATPITYEADGRQYVLVTSFGKAPHAGARGAFIAYALPQ